MNCDKTANSNIQCPKCSGYPFFDEDDRIVTYCSIECQNQHHRTHSVKCEQYQCCRALARAARLMQEAWLVLREHSFDHCFSNPTWDEQNRVLTLNMGRSYKLRRFDETWAWGNAQHRLLMLTVDSCTNAVQYSHNLVRALLQDICEDVESQIIELMVLIAPDQRPIETIEEVGKAPDHETYHHILQVTLDDKSLWAIDLSGAQYGHFDALLPWPQYEKYIAEDRIGVFADLQDPYEETGWDPLGRHLYYDVRHASLHYLR
ncbi:hypothetical protein EJ08DRAFT_337254 [Tothia fuscella]|uniref:MYND-type domain-containing protein n=1 Tax=Tothia fuscella TaxID=1048955 RepID=A0A9P4U259_9PEZI|nr:hypothetical protein EJ08DRAFT_337254 [Tothia fuscella]